MPRWLETGPFPGSELVSHRDSSLSKLELGFQLDRAWCVIAPYAAQDAGWRSRQIEDLAESLVLDLIVG